MPPNVTAPGRMRRAPRGSAVPATRVVDPIPVDRMERARPAQHLAPARTAPGDRTTGTSLTRGVQWARGALALDGVRLALFVGTAMTPARCKALKERVIADYGLKGITPSDVPDVPPGIV